MFAKNETNDGKGPIFQSSNPSVNACVRRALCKISTRDAHPLTHSKCLHPRINPVTCALHCRYLAQPALSLKLGTHLSSSQFLVLIIFGGTVNLRQQILVIQVYLSSAWHFSSASRYSLLSASDSTATLRSSRALSNLLIRYKIVPRLYLATVQAGDLAKASL